MKTKRPERKAAVKCISEVVCGMKEGLSCGDIEDRVSAAIREVNRKHYGKLLRILLSVAGGVKGYSDNCCCVRCLTNRELRELKGGKP